MPIARQSTENILILHEGEITMQDSERLFARMRTLVDNGQAPRAAFRALVELVQNVRIHGGGRGAAKVWKDDASVLVQTRNDAPPETVAKMRNIINFINEHAADITPMMRELRKAPLAPDAQGAGLGLMELRRLSGHDIDMSGEIADVSNYGLVITIRLDHKTPL